MNFKRQVAMAAHRTAFVGADPAVTKVAKQLISEGWAGLKTSYPTTKHDIKGDWRHCVDAQPHRRTEGFHYLAVKCWYNQ